MRRLMTKFYRVRSNPEVTSQRFALRGVSCALVVAGALAVRRCLRRTLPRGNSRRTARE